MLIIYYDTTKGRTFTVPQEEHLQPGLLTKGIRCENDTLQYPQVIWYFGPHPKS